MRKPLDTLLTGCSLAGLVVVGTLATGQTVRHADNQMRQEPLRKTLFVGETLSPARVRALSAEGADLEPALAYDPGSVPTRRAGPEDARDPGRSTASAPVTPVQSASGANGMLVFRPVFAVGRAFASPAHATPDLPHLYPRWRGWLTALAGLAITAVLVIVTSRILRQRRALEDLLAERTSSLRESEEKYRILFSDSPDAYLLLAGNAIVDCNRAAERMLGTDREQILGRSPAEFSPEYQPDGRPSAEAGAEKITETLRSGCCAFEWMHRRPDGTTFWVEVSISRTTMQRRPVLFTSLRDIGHRKQAEVTLRASEENFRNYFASIDDMIFVGTPEGRILYANPAVFRKLGYTTEDLRSAHLLDVHPADRRAEAKDIFAAMFRGERSSCPLPLAARVGKLIPVETRVWFGRWNGSDCVFGVCKDLTAEQEAHQRFERLFRSNPALMALSTLPDRRFSDVNDAFLDTLGYTRSEIIGRTSAELALFLQPEQAAIVAERIETEGRVSSFELQVRHKDGTILEGLFSGEIIRSQGRQYFLTVMVDITARKQAEAQLQEERRRLNSIIQGTNVGTWEWNALTGQTSFNERWAEIVGYTLAELAPISIHTWRDLAHPDDLQVSSDLLERHFRGELDSYECECRMRHKNGNWVWVLDRGSVASRTPDGKALLISGTHQDITQRKQGEEALRASQESLKRLIGAAQDAIIMMDPKGAISLWNHAAERIFGYRSQEVLGKNLHELLAPVRFHEAHAAAFAAFRRTGRGAALNRIVELTAIRRDGSEFPLELSLAPLELPDGWHAVGILRDITERKRVEAELLETNRHLEEATSRANEMAVRAEHASAAKSEFLANMSHEIRTPMNGVLGMVGLLLDTDLTPEQRHYARTARGSAENLLGLINDILDFSKIEAGKLELETLEFDLGWLLGDFTSTLALRAEEKGLELLCRIDPNVPTRLRGDPGRLRQILNNLAGNAIKFTHAGEVIIHVSLPPETPPPNTSGQDIVLIHFSVSDTGIGIPEEKTGLLFDKFSQVDATTTRQYGGTGLGLAISKQLAELMGGQIGVRSQPGQGSTFWFTVRLQPSTEPPQTIPPLPARLDPVRVLIVDDNLANRQILMSWLASWGMRPSEAPDGPTALEALHRAVDERDPFQLAIIDFQMPGMDGLTLGSTVRSESRLAVTRMVMLSSLAYRNDASRLTQIGFVGNLTKPVRPDELRTVLAHALAGRTPAHRMGSPEDTRLQARQLANRFAHLRARILLAEDNTTNQQVAIGLLNKLGIAVDAVANGAEAVTNWERIPYDLILMDVQMPEMDGLEATRRIRQLEELRRSPEQHGDTTVRSWRASPFHERRDANPIPIVAMTAHAMQGDRAKCLAVGMVDYLTKPVEVAALVAALEQWLPRSITDTSTSTRGSFAGPTSSGPAKADAPAPNPAPNDATRSSSPVAEAQPPGIVFDRATFLDRLVGDEALAARITEGFLKDIPAQMERLKEHAAAGRVQDACALAHKIKGAAGTVGGQCMMAVALDIEQAAKADQIEVVVRRLPDLDAEFERLKKAMKPENL